MRSPTLLLNRMHAAETSASSAIADWTPLTVVSRSPTTAEIETFISDVSTTSTNIAAASRTANRELCGCCSGTGGLASLLTEPPTASERVLGRLPVRSPDPAPPRLTHCGWAGHRCSANGPVGFGNGRRRGLSGVLAGVFAAAGIRGWRSGYGDVGGVPAGRRR